MVCVLVIQTGTGRAIKVIMKLANQTSGLKQVLQVWRPLFVKELTPTHNKHGKKGQTLVEYGLILALVSVVIIFMLNVLGGQINNVFNTIINTLSAADI